MADKKCPEGQTFDEKSKMCKNWNDMSVRERAKNIVDTATAWRNKFVDDEYNSPSWHEVTEILDIAEFILDASIDDPLELYREALE